METDSAILPRPTPSPLPSFHGSQVIQKGKRCERYQILLKFLKDQELVVRLKNVPLQAKPAETIVIPRAFAFTLAKSLHDNLNHPSPSQMLKQFQKPYFALDKKILLQQVYESCDYPCQASKILPKETMNFSTTTKSSKIDEMYNADVTGWKISEETLAVATSFLNNLIV